MPPYRAIDVCTGLLYHLLIHHTQRLSFNASLSRTSDYCGWKLGVAVTPSVAFGSVSDMCATIVVRDIFL